MGDLLSWEQDPKLYLFTSLTAGSSHIVTATSRVETILKANRLPFTYIDTATDEGARRLFQRRARGKKLPLLVKEGFVVADLDEIEEWNEFGELKDNIGPLPAADASSISVGTATSSAQTAPKAAPSASQSASASKLENVNPDLVAPLSMRVRQLGIDAAEVAKGKKTASIGPTKPLYTTVGNTTSPTTSTSTSDPPATAAAETAPSIAATAPATATATPEAAPAISAPAPPSAPLRDEQEAGVESSLSASSGTHQKTYRGSSLSMADSATIKQAEQAVAVPEKGNHDAVDLEEEDGHIEHSTIDVKSRSPTSAGGPDKPSLSAAFYASKAQDIGADDDDGIDGRAHEYRPTKEVESTAAKDADVEQMKEHQAAPVPTSMKNTGSGRPEARQGSRSKPQGEELQDERMARAKSMGLSGDVARMVEQTTENVDKANN